MLSFHVEAVIPENRFVSKMSKLNCNIIPPPYQKTDKHSEKKKEKFFFLPILKKRNAFIVLLKRFEGKLPHPCYQRLVNTDYVKGQAMESVRFVFMWRKSL